MKRIYVAGPLGAPDEGRRARLDAALAAGAALVQAGLAPFVPHLWAAAMHADGLATYEQWMAYDFAWLDVCDAVLRIPGHSPGADREVARALAAGLPVFASVGEVVVWARRGGHLMAKHQTRKSVSVRGTTYRALRFDCAQRNTSLSDYVEDLVARDFHERGLADLLRSAPPVPQDQPRARPSTPLSRAQLDALHMGGTRERIPGTERRTSHPAPQPTLVAAQAKQPARPPREKDAGSPEPAAGSTPCTPPPAEDFPKDAPPAHLVPGAALREPGRAVRRMDKQELVDLRRAQREGISGGTDDPARSGRTREKAPAVVAPARGARNVVLW